MAFRDRRGKGPGGPPTIDPDHPRRRRGQDDDDRDRDHRDRDRGLGRQPAEAAMRTSASTTAPAVQDAAGGQDADDLDAFFSSGHGPAMHYDRSQAEAEQSEAGSGG